MGKTSCKLSDKKYEKQLPEEAEFKCKKCDRLAKKEKHLCKPEKIKKK